jgi:serpin B
MFLLIGFLVLLSCTKDDDPISPNDPPPDEIITAQNIFDFRNANLTFSQKIFKEIVDQTTTDQNIMISPISISIALSMLNNGAANNTKDEIKTALEYEDVPDYCINKLFLQLANKLDSLNNIIDLGLANSAWFDNDFPVRDTYVELTKDYFDAEIRNLDLDVNAAIDTINTWVSDNTGGKIEDILNYDTVGAEFCLINAINFQGFWKFPFDPEMTENRRFYSEDGSSRFVSTMTDNCRSEDSPCRKFEYLVTDSFKAVKMPYGAPDSVNTYKDVSMYVFIPDSTLNSFIDTELNTENWNSWMDSFIPFIEQFPDLVIGDDMDFSIPRFKFDSDLDLIPVLQNLGMNDTFTSGVADLSNATDAWQGLFVSKVKQKTFIEVNEEGTSAAAATVVVVEYGLPPEFKVNKPFFFAIRDDLTGTILFMGQVYDPQY